MKILILAQFPISGERSGASTHIERLSYYLAHHDNAEVFILNFGDNEEVRNWHMRTIYTLPRLYIGIPLFWPIALIKIQGIMRSVKPDVIHALGTFPYPLLSLLMHRAVPVIITVFSLSSIELRFERDPLRILKKIIFAVPSENIVLYYAPTIIVQTAFMQSKVTKKTHARIRVIREGIETGPDTRDLSLEKGLHPDIFLAVAFRRLKGVDILLHAVHKARDVLPELRVYLAGSGEEEMNLKSLVYALGIEKNVSFLGFIANEEEILSFYRSARITVVPSRWDNDPFAPLHAAMSGRPAIVSDTAHSSVTLDGVTGYVVPGENIDEFAGRIIRLLTDDILREQMGRAARERVKMYEWDVVADETYSAYMDAILEREPGPGKN